MAEPVNETPAVGQMLASNDVCPEIVHGRQTWKVGHPDQDAKKRLEKLAAKVALDEVRQLRDTLDADAYQEAFAEKVRSLGEYKTWRPGWQKVVLDPANAHLFLLSLVQAHRPTATEAEVIALAEAAPEEVTAAYAQVLPDFFHVLLAGLKLTADQQARVDAALGELRGRLTPTREAGST